MLLTAIFPWKREAHGKGSNREALPTENPAEKGKTIPFEMDIHVPCHVAGITRNGSKWEGQATTQSISSFRAYLLLPIDAELEGEIMLTFEVPPPLGSLFPKRRFRANAEVKPSGAAAPSMSTKGRKVICIVFEKPIYFNLK